MASSTLYGGDSYNEHELQDPDPPQAIRIQRPEIGYIDQPREVESSPEKTDGGDSTQSSRSGSSSNDSQTLDPPEPAPVTENPFSPPERKATAASSAATGGRKATPKRSAKQDEFDEFE